MSNEFVKVTHGWCEQVFNEHGFCTEQSFTPQPEAASEYRTLQDDEPIEDPLLLKRLEIIEKFQDFEMVQPADFSTW